MRSYCRCTEQWIFQPFLSPIESGLLEPDSSPNPVEVEHSVLVLIRLCQITETRIRKRILFNTSRNCLKTAYRSHQTGKFAEVEGYDEICRTSDLLSVISELGQVFIAKNEEKSICLSRLITLGPFASLLLLCIEFGEWFMLSCLSVCLECNFETLLCSLVNRLFVFNGRAVLWFCLHVSPVTCLRCLDCPKWLS